MEIAKKRQHFRDKMKKLRTVILPPSNVFDCNLTYQKEKNCPAEDKYEKQENIANTETGSV